MTLVRAKGLSAASRRSLHLVLGGGAVAAVVLALLAVFWTGFLGSDDAQYAYAAMDWLEPGVPLGTDHWSLRHTVVLPIAASFSLFGVSEAALVAPTVLATVAIHVLTFVLLARYHGAPVAAMAAAMVATVPLLISNGTYPTAEVMELLWVVASLAAFTAALASPRPFPLLVGAGVAAGLAWMTRETAIGLLIFYGVLFLRGYGMARRWYWAMALGFAAVVGTELAVYALATGDPLYRLRIDVSHDDVSRAAVLAGGFDRFGNLTVHPYLYPFAMLLANQEFMFLYVLAVPACVWAWRRVVGAFASFLRLLMLLGLVWFATTVVLANALYLIPRYETVPTWAAGIVVASWILLGLAARGRAAALTAGLLLVGGNLAGIYVENRGHFFPERQLVRIARANTETFYTDPKTRERADFLLASAGLRHRVLDSPPPEGALFVHVPQNVAAGRYNARVFNPAHYAARKSWPVVASFDPGRKLIGVVLEAAGLDRALPRFLYRRLDRPNAPVRVYLVCSACVARDGRTAANGRG